MVAGAPLLSRSSPLSIAAAICITAILHPRHVTGPLAGGDVEDKLGRGNWGNLVFVIDPELLGPADEFKDKVEVSGKRSQQRSSETGGMA